ncbi:MAG TPA: ADP-ribosylglycohydrolase family protein [Phycisphaerales bacterium]|nr:ADP-ribosylglycohydrolase family protein [Phycisphaerales bacterium]
MLGSIAGDIIGSVYESCPIKTMDFALFEPGCVFTDDTVMTVATAWAILNRVGYAEAYKNFGRRYPGRGYGETFGRWLMSDSMPAYNSWGNGSAMRVSPVGFACQTMDAVLDQARQTAEVTHNHPEGIKGAQAVALSVFLARQSNDKAVIKREIASRFGYDLNRTIDQIRPAYGFDVSCQGTVPEAIVAFLESDDFEHAVRLAVSLGADSDTLACITGGIAEAYYKTIPEWIAEQTRRRLPQEFLNIIEQFRELFFNESDNDKDPEV